MSILKKPLITEKYTKIGEKLNVYAFMVDKRATKEEIRDEIEKVYEVSVAGVRTMIYAGRTRNRMTKSRYVTGKTVAFKKAIVTLKDGETIDFYGNTNQE